ncbi:RsmB/NOP family class I SAM-dependent RNA methyltransferase [Novosphingobium tardum]|uniref:RsmB/NOP family class I SAM-dependent RNA methyltransferase n=1 Tax=Novosphingobium tardum TaxID=1538021 RepID=A0ABV8RMR5_9SPHN
MSRSPDPSGLAARQAALRLLDAVLRRGEPVDQAAPNVLRNAGSGEDRALALAITGEVLRWLADLDALIDSATAQALPDDAKVRTVLRMMLAQALRLGTPPHAVLATGLALLTGGPRRLAHGVFSTSLKREAALPAAPTLPPAVAARWEAAWPRRVPAIAAMLADPPPLDITLRDPSQTERWAEALGGRSLMAGHVRIARSGSVQKMAGFERGEWWVQDLAASLPARLLGPGEGRRALDLCAAPGGKTMQLAAAGWQVTALDKSSRRAERLRDNLSRSNLSAQVVIADALEWAPDDRFDAILIDAPCSATGTCRRHPDVLHRIGSRQIEELAALQATLLDRAAGWLAAGGRLVYAVCSLEPAEGEDRARAFTQLAPDPALAGELPEGIVPTPEGWLRTDPAMLGEAGGLDGFFAARWRA